MSIYVNHASLYFANVITNKCKIRTSYTLFEAIHKKRNIETGNGMWRMQGTWEMFIRIPGNVFILVFRRMLEKIPENVQEDFEKYFDFYINKSCVLLKKSKR